MSNSDVISRKPGWLAASLGDELVMMNAASGVYLNLLGTGGRIWEMLEAPRAVSVICDALTSEYEVPPEHVRGEVIAFLDALQKHDAVQFTPCGE